MLADVPQRIDSAIKAGDRRGCLGWVDSMEGRRNPFIAREGLPFLALAGVAFGLSLRYLDVIFAVAAAMLFFVLYLVFRDPRREVPASPLGVVSPVDGRVVTVDVTDKGVFHGEANRVVIRIDSLGTYTASTLR